MAISINVQTIKGARAKTFGRFSTVDLKSGGSKVSLFFEGEGHEELAEKLAVMMNGHLGVNGEEEEVKKAPPVLVGDEVPF